MLTSKMKSIKVERRKAEILTTVNQRLDISEPKKTTFSSHLKPFSRNISRTRSPSNSKGSKGSKDSKESKESQRSSGSAEGDIESGRDRGRAVESMVESEIESSRRPQSK